FAGDEEASEIWQREVGLPASRVIALSRKDNFWQMGDTGPAGPCSELHYDMEPGGDASATPASDPDRFLEIWNLVFMQYDLQPGGGSQKLPAPCVDTGAGLERMTAVLSGVRSNYDTDLFQPLIAALAGEAGIHYGQRDEQDISLRVIADHLRAITMLVCEGVIPGPEKRGSVLRRILRRALRHGRLLSLPAPFLHRHLEQVVDVLGGTYPELRENLPVAEKVVRREEERFERTLADGFEQLEERIAQVVSAGATVFPGEEAFVLESERGLPLDLLRDALDERRLKLDEEGYRRARRRHVETSRVVSKAGGGGESIEGLESWVGRGSRFVGYSSEQAEDVPVLALFGAAGSIEALEEGDEGEVLLETTPFYAESGGQVGDRGRLIAPGVRVAVQDCRSPLSGVVLHRVRVEAGRLAVGDRVLAEVDAAGRMGARRHHTATHLLHAALREVLGSHVKQAGSLVAPERLRFDFSHFEGIGEEELAAIEAFVNRAVMADYTVETREMPLEQALESGAIAFFGDRYGETVRVVRIDPVSTELCGGTHVARTGQIGVVRIVSERGVAAGVRRIEAVAGIPALAAVAADRRLLAEIARHLGAGGEDVLTALDRRLERLRRLEKEVDALQLKLARGESGQGAAAVTVGDLKVITRRAEGLERGQRRELADSLRLQDPAAVVVLGAADGGKASLLVALGKTAAERIDARKVIRVLGPLVGGGGGGRPDLAEAGGKRPEAIDQALAAAPGAVEELLA
ncbi:MAG TPA: alanine--tRNA ligase, partial [Acidobacteria bacterium]|nr:alanine--tRNA ligase [Acidobacteriota bacterium]